LNRKTTILYLIAFMFCAVLPMAPVMSAAINTLTPGYVAEMGNSDTSADLPLRSLESERWDLMQIKAPAAWGLAGGGNDVVVAVLDSGIDAAHPSLQGKVKERVVLTSNTGIDVIRGHGTHIAGLIAAAINQTGNSGLAYNAGLLDVQVAENNGQTDALKVAKGIIWAVDHGAQVINISIVINQTYPLLEYAVNYAWEKGCVIVAAAGNNGLNKPVYPAAYPHVLAVAASDQSDNVTRWSGQGEWVDVVAPGVDIYSTLPGNQFGFRSGSSFSSALVSGEAALLFPTVSDQNNDGKVNDEVQDLILSNSDMIVGLQHPEKRINAYNAARAADIILGMLPTDVALNKH
jgi:subtilisin family serine protease